MKLLSEKCLLFYDFLPNLVKQMIKNKNILNRVHLYYILLFCESHDYNINTNFIF